MKYRLCLLLFFVHMVANAQTLGGGSVFSFLKLPAAPQLTALGGVNTSQPSNDIGLAFNNPSLLTDQMHTQFTAVFNNYYSGVHVYHAAMGYHLNKFNTNIAYGLQYFDYGSITATDASGNVLGQFRPVDWVMQVSASHAFYERWNAGASLKYIHSAYDVYRSNGIALDAGVHYKDSSGLFSASLLIKNLGFQLKEYAGTRPDDLPFDLQVGFTKRLKDAPFSFSVTAHHLHQFNIRYSDTTFNNDNGYANGSDKKITLDKLFRHFVFATTVYGGDKIEVTAAYNYLRRQELKIGAGGNGITGFSLGVAALFPKLQIRYGRAWYQNATGYNQLGVNMRLDRLVGLGRR